MRQLWPSPTCPPLFDFIRIKVWGFKDNQFLLFLHYNLLSLAITKMKLTNFVLGFILTITGCGFMKAATTIDVPISGTDQTELFRQAFAKAAALRGQEVIIKLQKGTYNISRANSNRQIYHVSNTTAVYENPDPTKHVGIWIKDLKNITIDGNGATIMTHGEMTSFAIDNCENIRLKDFRIDAADPSVVEITITKVGSDFIEFDVLPPTKVEVTDGIMCFKGEGWLFGDEKRITNHEAIAQVYDFETATTLRTPSPIRGYTKAESTGPNSVKLFFNEIPQVKAGERFQLRHSIRNEVCGFIVGSKDIEITNVDFNFLGNFGIVSQFSENVTFHKVNFEPYEGSGRTNAGFADFLQFSSCKGLLTITDCKFAGSHDDPINIHGTHLQVTEITAPNRLTVAYRHPQTFGFDPFKKGDQLIFVNRETLNYEGKPATVEAVHEIDGYKYEITLNKNIKELLKEGVDSFYAVENLTWTPDVIIRGNYFTKTPTRAILITTRGKSRITGNTFFRTPMASILVADDANSWYESGPVTDLTINDNIFIDCSSPVILVAPEIKKFSSPVHSNIAITGNQFIGAQPGTIDIKASEGIVVKNNLFEVNTTEPVSENNLILFKNVTDYSVENNKVVNKQ